MKLVLSSAALSDAPLAELVDAAARRGFAGVVLEEGCAHGVQPGAAAAAAAMVHGALADAGVALMGLRLAPLTPDAEPAPPVLLRAELARSLGVPLIVPVASAAAAPAAARWWQRSAPGTRLVLEVAGGPGEVLHAAAGVAQEAGDGVALGWAFTPDAEAPLEAGGALAEVAEVVSHIRLGGGGPETQAQGGAGIGSLMAQLALSGYAGSITVAPSTPRFRTAWAFWLGRHGGSGCGSKEEDRRLVLAPLR